jgi:hypothetical protein
MHPKIVPISKATDTGIPLSASAMGWVAYWRADNGSAKAGAIFKVGGRLFVDVEKFLEWMKSEPRISPPGIRGRRKAAPPAVA